MKYITKNLKCEHPAQAEKFEIETEVGQYESLPEFVTAVGGDEKALQIVNTVVANASATPCRIFAKSKEGKNLDFATFVSRIKDMRKNFSFAQASGKITKAEKVSLADRALGIANDSGLSDEQKAAKILEALRAARS